MSNPFRDWYVFFNLIKETIMAKLDYLKEKADRLRRWFTFLLNVILTIMVGSAGLIFSYMTDVIGFNDVFIANCILLVFLIKVAIMVVINYKQMLELEKELLEA